MKKMKWILSLSSIVVGSWLGLFSIHLVNADSNPEYWVNTIPKDEARTRLADEIKDQAIRDDLRINFLHQESQAQRAKNCTEWRKVSEALDPVLVSLLKNKNMGMQKRHAADLKPSIVQLQNEKTSLDKSCKGAKFAGASKLQRALLDSVDVLDGIQEDMDVAARQLKYNNYPRGSKPSAPYSTEYGYDHESPEGSRAGGAE